MEYYQGRSIIGACLQDRNNTECSVYMWVVLLGTEVAHSECGKVDVSGCILLRIEVAKINGSRAHIIDFNCMISPLGSTQLNYPQCL